MKILGNIVAALFMTLLSVGFVNANNHGPKPDCLPPHPPGGEPPPPGAPPPPGGAPHHPPGGQPPPC